MSKNQDGLRQGGDDPTDELFALPPGEFVAARNRVAGELKKAGQKDVAAAVKAMPKPTASVWAVNRVSRGEPAAMKRFLEVSEELRNAQTRGGGSEDARRLFQGAQARQREALDEVIDLAQKALDAGKLGASRAVLDRVASNLRWGVLSDESRALLARGRLAHDVAPPDFSALLGEASAAEAPRQVKAEREHRKPDKGGEPDQSERGDEHERLAAARERARFLRAAISAARSQEARALTSATRARVARERTERALETARRELAQLEGEAAEAARAHAEAEEAASTHAAEIARLTKELEEAEER